MSITLKVNPLEEYDPRQLQFALFADDETEGEDRNGEHSFSLVKPLQDEDE